MIHLALTFPSLNTSIQVGDLVFYIPPTSSGGGFDYSSTTPILFGTVSQVEDNTITVEYDI